MSLATSLKITPSQQAAFTQGVIAKCGGDVSMVAASYASAERSRRNVVASTAKSIRDEWVPPRLCTLHWDSKMTPTLTNHRTKEECLTVVVGDATQLKVLGVPRYAKAKDQWSGAIIAKLTLKLMQEWKCSDRIVIMTFDITASNTGHLTAACIAIQDELQRAVLWSGCRHQIGEVILLHVFADLQIETSSSPDLLLFTRLRNKWNLVAHSSDSITSFRPADHAAEALKLLTAMKAEMVNVATEATEFLCDDYCVFSTTLPSISWCC